MDLKHLEIVNRKINFNRKELISVNTSMNVTIKI